MILFIIIACLFVLLCVWHFSTLKYVNPYKLIFVFGKKGCGKSTLLTKLVYNNLKAGKTVYTTENEVTYKKRDVVRTSLPINPKNIFSYDFPSDSVVFIDEVSLIWDNRDFKTMDKRVIEWFRYQRHHRVRVYLFSQTFDIDKKLRDLSDDMYLVRKYFRILVVASHIVRKPVVVHPSPEAPARIDDDMIVDSPLLALFGGRIYTSIPRWSKVFDSFR